MRMRPRSHRTPEGYKEERPAPIEILSRMAGRSNFLTPKSTASATNSVPMTPLDIAHAVATAKDELGAVMAMAMACQRTNEWPKVQRLGHARVLHHLRAQRLHPELVQPPHTYRARIALHDAFHDLSRPQPTGRQRRLGEAAKVARMKREHYRWMLRETMAYLEAAANTAAADAVRFLFARVIEEAREEGASARVSITDEGAVLVSVEHGVHHTNGWDLDLLIQEALLRPRRGGVLVLEKGA